LLEKVLNRNASERGFLASNTVFTVLRAAACQI
jgi:hypothetical protein